MIMPVFKKVSVNGFGDPWNSYAHSMAWFKGYLYVGTTRANLCMIKANDPPELSHWPVKCPIDLYSLDRRAQIWRCDPRTNHWQQVFVSPLVLGVDGKLVPRDIGYRSMAVFKDGNDPDFSLYVSSWSPAKAGSRPTIMRSINGGQFTEASELGSFPGISTYRTLVPFGERLFTSPTGKVGGKANVSDLSIVLEISNPKVGGVRPVACLGFGDITNVTVFEMTTFNGFLYAGTLNPSSGFQVWKGIPAGRDFRWIKVITEGAYRGNLNEIALSMCVFNDALYVGTGIQNGGYDRAYKVGPAAAELIRIYPDDSWDLIVGESKYTPEGIKYPISGIGPGFDNFFNGYIWRMAVHEGWLYAGTYNWSVFLPYLALEHWPPLVRSLVERVGVENVVQEHGGFHLWRSRDGEIWTPVTLSGFENPYNYGVRTMVSTPFGLYVGTANPFGPEVAIKEMGVWKYIHNPMGGLEIWLGK